MSNADAFELIKAGLMIANILLTLVLFLVTARDRKDKATVSSINRVEENLSARINSVDTRLSRAEQDMNHAPTHNDLGKIYDKLNEFSGEFKELRGEVRQSFKQNERVYQRLMELEAGKK